MPRFRLNFDACQSYQILVVLLKVFMIDLVSIASRWNAKSNNKGKKEVTYSNEECNKTCKRRDQKSLMNSELTQQYSDGRKQFKILLP
jgi:hypothetical protein